MVVYLYERLSDGIYCYSAPSDREYYNVSVFTSHGHLLSSPTSSFGRASRGCRLSNAWRPRSGRWSQLGLRKKAITSGVSVLEREQELKRTSKKGS